VLFVGGGPAGREIIRALGQWMLRVRKNEWLIKRLRLNKIRSPRILTENHRCSKCSKSFIDSLDT